MVVTFEYDKDHLILHFVLYLLCFNIIYQYFIFIEFQPYVLIFYIYCVLTLCIATNTAAMCTPPEALSDQDL